MAQSPSHQWGQTIGTVVENGIVPILCDIARQHNVYLDSHGYRPARSGRKVTWTDRFGNTHDLDYVFERGGTRLKRGSPAGFVEVAWRRYTKHSRNKAQEIQGAIRPLVETYHEHGPFMATIIAGEFTSQALIQLESLGFKVLYFPYEDVIRAFESVGIDAAYGESTPASEFIDKIDAWNRLDAISQQFVAKDLIGRRQVEVKSFSRSLADVLGRTVTRIRISPLYGSPQEQANAAEAQDFLSTVGRLEHEVPAPTRVDIEVHYSNGDTITGNHNNVDDASEFVRRVCGMT